MVQPRVYVDFQNADSRGRVRLNCIGTVEDLSRQGIQLCEGLVLTLYTDDLDAQGRPDELLVDGIVSFSEQEHGWVAAVDWGAIRHASDGQEAPADGRPSPPVSDGAGQAKHRT